MASRHTIPILVGTVAFLTIGGAGLFSLFVVGAVFTTYYNVSQRRFRQRVRDDIQRELQKRHIMTSENESMGWFNEFMRRFFLLYEPVLAATIIQTVDAILVEQCPGFLDSIRLTTFTLGTKAPIIDFVRTMPTTADDIVCMDWKISFTPNDTADLTVRQASRKINPKICLTARIGRGFVGAGMPILVEDISFIVHARIKMKLISTYPHVQTVDVSLMEPPQFDFVLKPVGGNTFGFDINIIPGLEGFIKGQVDANVGPMMYHPNAFTINLEELLSGTPLDTAVGVLQINIWDARNLKATKLGGGTPDPYVSVSIDGKLPLARTKFQHSTSNPRFKSTSFVLLNNLNGMLTFSVMDYNEHRPDSKIGQASWDLAELNTDTEHENLSTPVMKDGKERGSLQYSLSYYPVLKPELGPDGKALPLPETRSGVVRLTLHQAKDLDKKGGLLGDVNPTAHVLLNGKKVKATKTLKRTLSPIWEEHMEFLVTERKRAVVGIQILNDREITKDPVVGYLSVKLDDLLAAKGRQQDWFPLTGTKEGRIRMSAEWKPVLMSGSVNGGSGYSPAIGLVKFWMKKADDVKNVEAALGGKSDPYVALRLRGQQVDGSVIVNNNLNPVWDEILYAPVHSLNEAITVEVMDYQNSGKDRSIGSCEVKVGDLAVEGRGDRRVPYGSTGKSARSEKLHLGRGAYKGTIFFDCEFLPAVALNGVEFEGAGNEAAKKAGDGEEEGDEPEAADVQTAAATSAKAVAAESGAALTAPTVATNITGEVTTKIEKPAEAAEVKNKPPPMALANEGDDKSKSTGVDMTREELLATQSGILVFNILSGEVAKKGAKLEIAFDDGYWPTYTTEAARSHSVTWDEVGEATIKELDWSRIWMKLRTGAGDEGVFAEFQGNTKDVLERALDQEAEFTLTSDAGTGKSTIKLTAKYIPVDMHLELVETVANTGYLGITAVSAHGLRAADKSVFKSGGGSSDPYVTVELNGERVAKSKVVKKTLNPEWNEKLPDVIIPSRVKSEVVLEVYDWDQVGTADKLGQATVDLLDIEPFEQKEVTLPVTGKGSAEGGTITIKLLFRPEFLSQRGPKGTSLNLGRSLTSAGKFGGHLVGGAVGGVAGGVGKVGSVGIKGVGSGVSGVSRIIRGGGKRSSSAAIDGIPENGELPPVPDLPEGVEPAPIVDPSLVPANASFIPPPPNGPAGGAASLAAHSRTASGDYAGSIAESTATGTPSKRKSRIHNPFKKHH